MSETPCAKNYLFFQGGPGHSRRPRPNPPTGGLIPIPGLSDTIYLTEGQPIGGTELLPSSVYQSGSGTANYIFLSISGAQSGNQTWIAPQNYANLLQQNQNELLVSIGTVIPGANPMTLTFVYGPPHSDIPPPPPQDSGASIDAFFEGTSSYIDNNFVACTPDNGATNSGNNYGWVDTWSDAETITASEFITPDGVDPNEVSAVFNKWIDLANPLQSAEFNGKILNAAKGDNYYALALYKVDPCQSWRTLLANFNVGDFPNPVAAEKALLGIRAGLLECEKQNGELPTVPTTLEK